MASWEKTEVNSAYSAGRETLGLAASAAMASSVAVVRWAMTGDLAGIKRDPQQIIR